MKFLDKLLFTENDTSVIWIRFVVGIIFFMEGIQKFVYADTLGVGRFIKIGIPYPEIMAPFVGVCEILFGIFILLGFLVRISFFPQIIIMITAILSTKLTVLLHSGILTFFHDARNDLLMIFGLVFLFHKGSGAFSIDTLIINKRKNV